MHLLICEWDGVKTFEGGKLRIDLYASDRVPRNDRETHVIKPPFYSNNIVAIAGVNASGKSTVLRFLYMGLRFIKGFPVSDKFASYSVTQLLDGKSKLSLVFEHDSFIWLLQTSFKLADNEDADAYFDKELRITDEFLYRSHISDVNKKDLANLSTFKKSLSLFASRDKLLESNEGLFIRSDSSIAGGWIQPSFAVSYLSPSRKSTMLPDAHSIPDEVIHLLDSSIEHIGPCEDDESSYQVALSNNEEMLRLTGADLQRMLSSGTTRGITLTKGVLRILERGGYLLIDEIETNLNKQIIRVFIELFSNPETNPNGATLIFTTHYSELLDYVHRKDAVYFLVRNKQHKTKIVKYSDEVKRIENKKSEVFISNYIKGTAPKFSDVCKLREMITGQLKAASHE